jgi:hypothetical protein
MRKLFVGLLVLGLAVGMLGMVAFAKKHSANADDKVTWTIQEFIEITIDDSSYDFGAIDAGVDTVSDDEANTLFVRSNTEWALDYSVAGSGSENLKVSLESGKGKGDAEIIVGYTLLKLRSMEAGDYSVTVTYTVTAK